MSNKSRINKINGKYYDLGTGNTSFLQVAKDLKRLGIKNFYFMLEIYDYSLININPYAVDKNGRTTLTKDQITRVLTECARNPWYYLREICRIPSQGGSTVPYKANRGNIAQAYCILHGYDSWLCLPRQQGKTESAVALLAWAYKFGTTNSQFIFFHKDGDGSKSNLKRLSEQIRVLPEYMRGNSIVDDNGSIQKGKDNATAMANPINGNSIVTKSKATSYEAALSLARGLSAPLLYGDKRHHYFVFFAHH